MTDVSQWQPTQPFGAEFSDEFQVDLAGHVLTDSRFATSVLSHLQPHVFSSLYGGAYLSEAIGWAKWWYDPTKNTHHAHPMPKSYVSQWAWEWSNRQRHGNPTDFWATWQSLLYRWYDAPAQTEEFVRKKVYGWIQRREEQSIIVEAKLALDKGISLDQMDFVEKVRRVRMIGSGNEDWLTFGFDAAAEARVLLDVPSRDVLASGFTEMDAVLSGGAGRREMVLIAAPPNVGKSTVSCSLGSRYVEQGHFVAHFTLEQSREQTGDKYLGGISGNLPSQLREYPEAMVAWMEYLQRSGGRLAIREYPSGHLTVDKLYADLMALVQRFGRRPDVIIVDYPDLMRARGQQDQRRYQLAEIYTELRGLAQEMNALMIAPTQTNRPSVDKDVITIEFLAECFEKAAIADVIIALCQSDEEYKNGRLRFFFAKNRVGKKFEVLPYRVNYELCKMEAQEKAEHDVGPNNLQAPGVGRLTASTTHAMTYGDGMGMASWASQ